MDSYDAAREARERPVAEATAARLERTLERIESHWIAQGVPIAGHLAPGLTDQEIDVQLEATAVELSEVARVIFRWHNGATANDPDLTMMAQDAELPNGLRFHSLAYLVEYWQGTWIEQGLQYAREVSAEEGEYGPWGPQWFPLFIDAQERRTCVTRSMQRRWSDQEPIFIARIYDADDPRTAAKMSSVVPLFEFLLLWLEHGLMRWDAEAQSWQYDGSINKMTFRETWWW